MIDGGYTHDPRLGQNARPSPASAEGYTLIMPRPILILVILLVVILLALFGLASLDREAPTTVVDQPVTNAAAH